MTNLLFGALQAGGAVAPGPALRLRDGTALGFEALWQLSARVANVLVAAGVRPGDRVALQAEKHPLGLAAYLGSLRCGAVFLPLNTAYTAPEVAFFLDDAEPAVFICAPERAAELAGAAAQVETVLTLGASGEGSLAGRLAAAGDRFEDVARGPGDLAAILYTSGTTGRSKGAMQTHANLLSNAEVLRDFWRFTAADVLIHALPIYHTHGLFVAANVALLAGATMLFLPRFNADEVIAELPGATAMMGVPTFYTRLLQHPALNRQTAGHMRLFTSGSAPLLASTHDAWRARTGQAIVERYGMTETNITTSNPYDGARVAGTVGVPLPGVDLRIVGKETGAEVAAGEIGIIEVRGPGVFAGYWRLPEKTRAEFRDDGFFHTGDLARLDAEGYVHIVGRDKDLIISGGFNVYPKEVEQQIDGLPGVEESAVIGVPHPDWGEAVVALVVAERGADLTEAGILAGLGAGLARFKLPKRVILLDALPRNTMGKVLKAELRKAHADLFAPAAGN